MNNTMDEMDMTEKTYKEHFIQQHQNTHFSQAHMGYFPGQTICWNKKQALRNLTI